MIPKNRFYFLENASTAQQSDTTSNVTGETLTMQVEGTATSFSLQLLGCSDNKSNDFYPITGFTLGFDTVDTITAKGIYTFGIEGFGRLKVNLTAVSGGSVTVFAKVTQGV